MDIKYEMHITNLLNAVNAVIINISIFTEYLKKLSAK